MGLFDSIAGQVLGNVMGDKGAMAQIALEMFNKNGGLQGILAKFTEAGLGDAVASWVGHGENIPVQASQITDILGSGALSEMAVKFGLTPELLSSQIAEHLPNLVDKMTPEGKVTANSGDLLSTVLSMLK
ncbi:MAG: YidB family protein [Methylophilus sp.]|jgi:uncharacterized protein YidB (DUF937 family)